jgi:hypothetical protein
VAGGSFDRQPGIPRIRKVTIMYSAPTVDLSASTLILCIYGIVVMVITFVALFTSGWTKKVIIGLVLAWIPFVIYGVLMVLTILSFYGIFQMLLMAAVLPVPVALLITAWILLYRWSNRMRD